jgi:hypothetical protein
VERGSKDGIYFRDPSIRKWKRTEIAIQTSCSVFVFFLMFFGTVYCDTVGTADGGTVVKVLRYKSEGSWFDSRFH